MKKGRLTGKQFAAKFKADTAGAVLEELIVLGELKVTKDADQQSYFSLMDF